MSEGMVVHAGNAQRLYSNPTKLAYGHFLLLRMTFLRSRTLFALLSFVHFSLLTVSNAATAPCVGTISSLDGM